MRKIRDIIFKGRSYIRNDPTLYGIFLELKFLRILQDSPQSFLLNIAKEKNHYKEIKKEKPHKYNKNKIDDFFEDEELNLKQLKLEIQASSKVEFTTREDLSLQYSGDYGKEDLDWILHVPKSKSYPAVDGILEGVVGGRKILILLQITKSFPSIHAQKQKDPGRIILTDYEEGKKTEGELRMIQSIKSQFTFDPSYEKFFVWVGPNHYQPFIPRNEELSNEYGLRQSLFHFSIDP